MERNNAAILRKRYILDGKNIIKDVPGQGGGSQSLAEVGKRKTVLQWLALCLVVASIVLSSCSGGKQSANIFGELQDGVYSNHALGIAADFDSNWEVTIPDEGTSFENNMVIMQAVLQENADNVNITVSDVGRKASGTSLDEIVGEEYMEEIRQLAQEQYSQYGLEIIDITKIHSSFLGDSNCPGSYWEVQADGFYLYQKSVVCILDHYMVTVTATSRDAGRLDAFLAKWYKI